MLMAFGSRGQEPTAGPAWHATAAVRSRGSVSSGGSLGACAVSIAFTQEHDNLRESLRRFLEQRSSTQDIRRLMESQDTYDPAVWAQLAQKMGLPGIAIPEEYGGSGYGIIEQVIILEEMGRALLPAP